MLYPHEQEEFDTLDDQFRVTFVLVTNDALPRRWTDFDDDYPDIDAVVKFYESQLLDESVILFQPDPAAYVSDQAPSYISLPTERVLYVEYETRQAAESEDAE